MLIHRKGLLIFEKEDINMSRTKKGGIKRQSIYVERYLVPEATYMLKSFIVIHFIIGYMLL